MRSLLLSSKPKQSSIDISLLVIMFISVSQYLPLTFLLLKGVQDHFFHCDFSCEEC